MSRTFRVNIYKKQGLCLEDWGEPDYYFECNVEIMHKIVDMLDENGDCDNDKNLIRLFPIFHESHLGTLYKARYEKQHVDFYAEPIYFMPDNYFIEIEV